MLLKWLSDNFISLSALILSPILAYIFGNRKQTADIEKTKAETDKTEAETDKTEAETKQVLVSASQTVILQLQEHIVRQGVIISDLNIKISELERRLDVLDDCVRSRMILEKQISELTLQLNKLRNAFEFVINQIKGQNPNVVNKAKQMLGEL